MGKGNVLAVTGLVDSIRNHMHFKNLLAYTITCVESHITPPNPDIYDNVDTILSNGGIEALVEAIEAHADDEDVLASISAALEKLCVDDRVRKRLADAHITKAVLKPVREHPEFTKGTIKAISVIENITRCEENIAIVIADGASSALIQAMKNNTSLSTRDNEDVMLNCSKTLASLSKKEFAVRDIFKEGGIPAIVAAIKEMAKHPNANPEILKSLFALLERIAEVDDLWTEIRNAGGVAAIVAAMEAWAENLDVLSAGSKVLGRIANATDLKDALEILKSSTASMMEKESAAAMVSNLAVNHDNVAGIIEKGGIEALLACINDPKASAKLCESCLRAVSRLAIDDKSIQAIFNANLMPTIVGLFKRRTEEGVLGAGAQCLLSVATSSKFIDLIAKQGGVEAIIVLLKKYPGFAKAVIACLDFLSIVSKSADVANQMIALGGVEAILNAMNANKDNGTILSNGASTLLSLSGYNGVPDQIIKFGGAEILCGAIMEHTSNVSLVEHSISVLNVVTSVVSLCKRVSEAGGVDAVVAAMHTHKDHDTIQRIGTEIIKRLVDEKAVLAMLERIKKLGAKVLSEPNAGNSSQLELAFAAIKAFSSIEEHAATVLRVNGPKTLSDAISNASNARELPGADETMCSGCEALNQVSFSNGGNIQVANQSSEQISDALKKHTDKVNFVRAAVELLDVLSSNKENTTVLLKNNIIEGLSWALKPNGDLVKIATPIASAFLNLSKTEEGGNQISRLGVRPLVTAMSKTAGQPEFETFAVHSFNALRNLALFEKIKKLIIKQGAVQAIVNGMRGYYKRQEVLKAGANALQTLVPRVDLAKGISDIKASAQSAIKARTQENLESLDTDGGVVGCMAVLEENLSLVVSGGSLDSFLSALNTIAPLKHFGIKQGRIVSHHVLGVARLAQHKSVPANSNASVIILAAVDTSKELPKSIEHCLYTLSILAEDKDHQAIILTSNGVERVMATMKEFENDEGIVASGMALLSTLSADADAARKIVELGGLNLLVKFMNSHANDAQAMEQALHLLSALALIDENVDTIIMSGVIPLAIQAMRTHATVKEIPGEGVVLLVRLATNETNCETIVRAGAVQATIAALKTHGSDSSFAENALFMLGSLAMVESNQGPMIEAGAVPTIISTMDQHSGNEGVLDAGMQVLQFLVTDDDFIKAITELEKAVASLDKTDASSEKLLVSATLVNSLILIDRLVNASNGEKAMNALLNAIYAVSTKSSKKEDNITFASVQGIGRLAAASANVPVEKAVPIIVDRYNSKYNTTNSKLFQTIVEAVSKMATYAPAGVALSSAGVPTLAVKTITDKGDVPTVLLALTLMSNISQHGTSANEIKTVNGVNSIGTVMNQHNTNRDVLVSAVATLLNLHGFITDGELPCGINVVNGTLAALNSFSSSSDKDNIVEHVIHALTLLDIFSANTENSDILLKQPTVETLLALLNAYSDNERVLTMVASIMARLVTTPEGLQQIMDSGALAKLIEILKLHPDWASYAENVVVLMHYAGQTDKGKGIIIKANGIDLLESLSSLYKDNEALTSLASSLLEALKSTQVMTPGEVKSVIGRLNEINPTIGSNLALGGELESITSKLSSMTTNETNASMISAEKGEKALTETLNTVSKLSSLPQQQKILESTSKALSNLADNKDFKMKRYDANPGLVKTLLETLAKNKKFGKLCEYSLNCLANLAENEANLEEIIKQGGVPLILEILKNHPDNEMLQKLGRGLLAQISKNPEGARQIAEFGGIEYLMGAMDIAMADSKDCSNTLQSLSSVSYVGDNAGKIVKLGGIKKVLVAMEAHPDNKALIEAALSLLNKFGEDPSNVGELKRLGALKIILAAMAKHHPHSGILKFGAEALGHMTGLPEILNAMVEIKRCLKEGVSAAELEQALNNIAFLGMVPTNRSPLVKEGAIKAIFASLEKHPGHEGINQAALRALASLAADIEGGLEMADKEAILFALNNMRKDPKNLSVIVPALEMLKQLAKNKVLANKMAHEGAIKAIVDVLNANWGNTEIMNSVLDTLMELAKNCDDLSVFAREGGIDSILKLIVFAMENDDFDMLEKSLNLLDRCCDDEANVLEVLHLDGIFIIKSCLVKYEDDEAILTVCASILNKIALNAKEVGCKAIIDSGAFETLLAALRKHPEYRSLAENSFKMMSEFGKYDSAWEAIAQGDMMELIQTVMSTHSGSEIISTTGADLLFRKGAVVTDEYLNRLVATVTNGTTGKTNKAQLIASLEKLAEIAEGDVTRASQISNQATINSIMGIIDKYANDADILLAAVKALGKLDIKDDVANMLAMGKGIRALLKAIEMHPNAIELLRYCIFLLAKFALHDVLKIQIAAEGGIELVIRTSNANTDVELLTNCCYALANIAFNNAKNVVHIAAAGGIKAVEKTMKENTMEVKLLGKALGVLSNLMFGNDENKLKIGTVCGDEIVNIIRVHNVNPDLFSNALRAIGNLCFCDENIPIVVGEGCTECVIDGMRHHWDDEEVLRNSLACIGNMASANVPVECVCDVGKRLHALRTGEDSLVVMAGEGAITTTLQAMRSQPFNAALLITGIDALANIADYDLNLERMIREGAIKDLISAMESHDWDEGLVDAAIKLLALFCDNPKHLQTILDLKGADLILAAIEMHAQHTDVLVAAFSLVYKMAQSNEANCQMVADKGLVDAVLRAFETHMSDVEFLGVPLRTLGALTLVKNVSKHIATNGCHLFMAAIEEHIAEPKLLEQILVLLGYLAFEPENIKIIVQFKGIKSIIHCIAENSDNGGMVEKAVRTLDNIAMANQEFREIVLNEKGRELILKVQESYAGDRTHPNVVDVCKSALLTIGTLPEKKKKEKKPEIKAVIKKEETVAEKSDIELEFEGYANKLKAGTFFDIWTADGKVETTMMVKAVSNLKEITVANAKGKEYSRLDLSTVIQIDNNDFLKKKNKFSRNPKPDCCITLLTREKDQSVYLEAKTASERDQWTAMFNSLQRYRKFKKM